jgi:uncharacterized protein YggE
MYRFGAKRENYVLLLVAAAAAAAEWASNTPCLRWKNNSVTLTVKGKGKGKAVPLQALTDLEGSRRLRLPDFMTVGT